MEAPRNIDSPFPPKKTPTLPTSVNPSSRPHSLSPPPPPLPSHPSPARPALHPPIAPAASANGSRCPPASHRAAPPEHCLCPGSFLAAPVLALGPGAGLSHRTLDQPVQPAICAQSAVLSGILAGGPAPAVLAPSLNGLRARGLTMLTMLAGVTPEPPTEQKLRIPLRSEQMAKAAPPPARPHLYPSSPAGPPPARPIGH